MTIPQIYKLFIAGILISASILYGQSTASDKLLNLYRNGNFEQLHDELKNTAVAPLEKRFYEALFEKDAEKAFVIYEDLFKNHEGRPKYLAAERLMEYYYARGYYSTASDYQRFLVENGDLLNIAAADEVEREPVVASNDQDEGFFIQVGAFGLEDNAQQMQKMLQTQKIESLIKARTVQNKMLYCVWVPGKKDFDETLQLANELKEKYQLDYRIIKE